MRKRYENRLQRFYNITVFVMKPELKHSCQFVKHSYEISETSWIDSLEDFAKTFLKCFMLFDNVYITSDKD